MFEIAGTRRTDKVFLAKIKELSEEHYGGVVERLRRLKIFSTVTETKSGVCVTEERRSISFSGDTTKGTPRGTFNLKLPNLFGRAENMEISVSTSKSMSMRFTKPVIWGSLNFLRLCGMKDVKRSPKEDYPYVRASVEMEGERGKMAAGVERIGYLTQRFIEFQKSFFCVDMKGKVGITETDRRSGFLKLQLETLLSRRISKNLFTSLFLSGGTILGNPHATERYYLGGSIRGYKEMSISPRNGGTKVGGRSFIEATEKFGVEIGRGKLFLFGSLGYVSEDSNVAKIVRCATRACMHRDTESLGLSVGLGVSVPVMKTKEGPVVGASFAIPLTSNKQTQRLQFGFDVDF